MSGAVAAAYGRLLAAGELKADPDQARAAAALDRLGAELAMRRGFFARLLAAGAIYAASICGAGSGAASRC